MKEQQLPCETLYMYHKPIAGLLGRGMASCHSFESSSRTEAEGTEDWFPQSSRTIVSPLGDGVCCRNQGCYAGPAQ